MFNAENLKPTIQEILMVEPLSKSKILSGWSGKNNIALNVLELKFQHGGIENHKLEEISTSKKPLVLINYRQKNFEVLNQEIIMLLKRKISGIFIYALESYVLTQSIEELSNINKIPIIMLPQNLGKKEVIQTIKTISHLKENFIHDQYIKKLKRQYMSDFIYDLLYNNFESKDDLIDKAKLWSFSLDASYQLFVINIGFKANKNQELLNYIETVIYNSTNYSCHKPIVTFLQDLVVVLLPCDLVNDKKTNKKFVINIASSIIKSLTNYLKLEDINIGIGRFYHSITDLCKSYQEAKIALELGKYINEETRVSHFDNLGAIRLMANISYDILEEYYREYLDKLLEHDEKNNTKFMQTLDMYLHQNGDLNKTAEKLYLHPNSLRYRIKKIEEITDLDLQKYENLLNLFLANKIYKMRKHGFGTL